MRAAISSCPPLPPLPAILGLSESLDRELGAFLDAVHAANTERNNELRTSLAAVVHAGPGRHRTGATERRAPALDGLYPDDGWRMLRDLDLLVPGIVDGRPSKRLRVWATRAAGRR